MSLLRTYYLLSILLNLAVAIFCADKYSRKDFPPGFIFGSSTSSYQVEGAANEDGRTPSILDTSAHAGLMFGATGDVSVDEYHKYKEDVKLMVETGLDAYRFSISWSRLLPNGRGPVNPKGLQYYNNLINELIRHGIQPHVTIYHFDLPQVLEDEYGGWVSRKIVKDFTTYAEVCFREFGDRIKYWTTLNEPNFVPLLSYDIGVLSPNRCSPPFGVINCSKGNSTSEPYLVAHHILLAHASAVRLYKKKYQGKQFGFIGINLLVFATVPLTNSTKDVLATQRTNDFIVGLIANPVVFGDYPETVKKNAGERLPTFTDQESKQVKGSFDFLGVNHYDTLWIKDNSTSLKSEHRDFIADMAVEIMLDGNTLKFAAVDSNNSTVEFPINPWGMQIVLEYFKQVYGNPPIYIHENGQRTLRNTSLEDTSRVKYMHAYIGSVLDSVRNGSNTRGYFTWSLMDVLELLGGYEVGYGLYYVDLNDPELKRQPKLSAHWYSQFLKGRTVREDGIIELPQHFSAFSGTDQ